MVINSNISTPQSRYICCDLEKIYLRTSLDRYEYIRLSISILPQQIIDAYNLLGFLQNGYVYCEIQWGMYGLPQAVRLAYNELVRQLETHGYDPCRHTPGIWRHKWRPIPFSPVVKTFWYEICGWAHAEHLVNTLQQYLTLKMDRAGTLYCGITLKWDYTRNTVNLIMTGYINAELLKYYHPKLHKPQHRPYLWKKHQYGQNTQYAKPADSSLKLDANGIKHIQKVIEALIYYARAIDSTMLMAINSI